MDQKAKEAFLDKGQWKDLVEESLTYKKECDKIMSVTFLHTIEPMRLYVKLVYDDGGIIIKELCRHEDTERESRKCRVLAETAFYRESR